MYVTACMCWKAHFTNKLFTNIETIHGFYNLVCSYNKEIDHLYKNEK